MAADKNKVRDRLMGLCSRREYCRADIMRKALAALDGDAGVAGEIVEMLVAEGYIDDLRYASAFARDKSSIAGWGAVKIRYMLSSKGIQKEVVDKALEGMDEEKASGRLKKVLGIKARALKGDPQMRMKLLRFALGRGYEYETVNKILNQVQDDVIPN